MLECWSLTADVLCTMLYDAGFCNGCVMCMQMYIFGTVFVNVIDLGLLSCVNYQNAMYSTVVKCSVSVMLDLDKSSDFVQGSVF